MKRKGLIIAVCILTTTAIGAQEKSSGSILDAISRLVSWVDTIDKSLAAIQDRELLRRCFRMSGDVAATVQRIYDEKLQLKVDFTANDRDGATGTYGRLRADLKLLGKELDEFSGLANVARIVEFDQIVAGMHQTITINGALLRDFVEPEIYEISNAQSGVLGDPLRYRPDIDSDLARSLEYTSQISAALERVRTELAKRLDQSTRWQP